MVGLDDGDDVDAIGVRPGRSGPSLGRLIRSGLPGRIDEDGSEGRSTSSVGQVGDENT